VDPASLLGEQEAKRDNVDYMYRLGKWMYESSVTVYDTAFTDMCQDWTIETQEQGTLPEQR
jgi:hypothetical protein